MTLRLTRLDANLPITADGQSPSLQFMRLDQKMKEQIEASIGGLETQLAAILAVAKRDKRAASYTSPTAVLTAADAGADATITIASHTRIYSDATTVAITGGALTGLAFETTYTVFYVDTTLADTTPTFQASTSIGAGYVGAQDGLHVLGVITTPANGAGPVTGGGAYAPGGTVGGEIP